jgi:hypothetical protein
MHRVELVTEVNKNEEERFIQKILAGSLPAVSMGMRTPYDVCSLCGNKAKNRAQYCDHLKFQMNRVLPNGQKVMAINPEAKFFDISFVIIPADSTAQVMRKVASYGDEVVSSAKLGEDYLKEAGIKESDLIKKVEAPITKITELQKDPKGRLYAAREDLDIETIKEMLKDASLNTALSSMMAVGVMPTPNDFQNMVLISAGREKLAEKLSDNNINLIDVVSYPKIENLDGIGYEAVNPKFIVKHASVLALRALTKKASVTRMLKVAFMSPSPMEEAGAIPEDVFYPQKNPSKIREIFLGTSEEPKLSPIKNPAFFGAALTGMYTGLQHIRNNMGYDLGKLDDLLLKNPKLIPIFLAAGVISSIALQKTAAVIDPNLITRGLIALPASYLYAGVQENKARRGEPIGKFENFVRKHPALMTILGTIGLGQVQKHLMKVSSYNNESLSKIVNSLSEEELDVVFEDLINL